MCGGAGLVGRERGGGGRAGGGLSNDFKIQTLIN